MVNHMSLKEFQFVKIFSIAYPSFNRYRLYTIEYTISRGVESKEGDLKNEVLGIENFMVMRVMMKKLENISILRLNPVEVPKFKNKA
jgi:hypothetical protein